MSPKGDPAKNKNGKSIKVKNLFLRAKRRLEKRPGWLRDTASFGSDSPGIFYLFKNESDGVETLCYGNTSVAGTAQTGRFRVNSTSWTAFTAPAGQGSTGDYTNAFAKMYALYSGDTGTAAGAFSFDGTTTNTDPFGLGGPDSGLGGATIEGFIRRLFIGAPKEVQSNNASPGGNEDLAYAFEGADWTRTGYSVANASNVRTATAAADGNTMLSAVSVWTTTAADEYVTARFDLRASMQARNVPLTLYLTNSTGVTVYASREIVLPTSVEDPTWQRYSLTGRIATSGTTVYVKIEAGTAAIDGAANDAFNISDSTAATPRALLVTKGRFVYNDYSAIGGVIVTTTFPSRIYWCETDDPTFWRSENYMELREWGGPITALRRLENRLFAFKENAVWSFQGTEDPDAPLLREHIFENVGCVGAKAIDRFENTLYFVGPNEVYRMLGGAQPESICNEDMREELFADGVSPALLEVMENERAVVVYKGGKAFIYWLDFGEWTYMTFTGASDAELVIRDLVYCKPTGETRAELYAIMDATADIVKLRSSQTQDNITGTARDVVAEYIFSPVETQRPRQIVTIEELGIDHEITASQTGSTCTYAASINNGASYTKTNACTLAPLAGAVGAYDIIRLPLWASGPRVLVKVTHSGLAGPTYFNLSGGEAAVQIRGREIEDSLPTAGAAAL